MHNANVYVLWVTATKNKRNSSSRSIICPVEGNVKRHYDCWRQVAIYNFVMVVAMEKYCKKIRESLNAPSRACMLTVVWRLSLSGRQRWREHRKLSLLTEALYDPLAQGCRLQRHNCWPQKVISWQASAGMFFISNCLYLQNINLDIYFKEIQLLLCWSLFGVRLWALLFVVV